MAAAAAASGAVLSAAGSIAQGNENANIANYNAQVATNNAIQSRAQGAENFRRQLDIGAQQVGAAQADYGAAGVEGGSGSALQVLRNSASNAELNALTVKNKSEIEATAYMNEAALGQYDAGNARVAGYMNAASSLLSGGGKAMSMSRGPQTYPATEDY